MSFINEKISKEDFATYNLAQVNKRMGMLGAPHRQWTIDRSRNYWLRLFYARHDHTVDNPGFTGMVIWDLYLDGCLISIETQELKTKSTERNCGIYFAIMSVANVKILGDCGFTEIEILNILKEALIAYAGGGLFSDAIGCEIELIYKDIII